MFKPIAIISIISGVIGTILVFFGAIFALFEPIDFILVAGLGFGICGVIIGISALIVAEKESGVGLAAGGIVLNIVPIAIYLFIWLLDIAF
ncbi:MAG: hypothetical protein ACFFD2_01710 [Promethearchaeota archaeon]